jgi:hypothetical protein
MANKPIIMYVDEFVKMYGNEIIEIASRRKNGKFKAFTNVLLKDRNEDVLNAIKEATQNVNQLSASSKQLLNVLNTASASSAFSAALGAVNLCATVAGFAIVCNKLNKVEDKISDVAKKVLDAHEQETFYKFDMMLGDYKNMLDCKKVNNEYTEEKYRELIDNEYAILKLLMRIVNNDTCNNKNDILYTIISLSSMLAVTLSNFDEVYYFEHKDIQKWHSSHNDWTSIYDSLVSKEFIEKLQDFMFIEEGYNQYQTDLFVITFIDNIKEAKQFVIDKQQLIEKLDSTDQLNKLMDAINKDIANDINNTFESMNLNNNIEVQRLVQTAEGALELYS